MNAVLLTARCLLAVVFLVAAVGKFLDLDGARQGLEEFGVPPRLARIGGPALPVTELAVVVALLIRRTAVGGAVGALALLIVFIAGVARAMSQGRAPDCHCFGQIHSEPAGLSTLIRNVVLAGVAVLVILVGTGPSLDGGFGALHGTQAALAATAVAAALFAVSTAQLWSDKRRLQNQLEAAVNAKATPGLPGGTPAPPFALAPVRGESGSLDDLRIPGRATMLVFVSTSCGPCLQMLPTLAKWQDSLAQSLALAAVFSGERTEIERVSAAEGLRLALAQEGEETFNAYALRATPSAVLISPDGAIAEAPAEGWPAIEALVRTAVAQQQG